METDVIPAPPEVAANFAPDEVDASATVSAAVVGLPNASCSCTVIGPSVALDVAVPEIGDEVTTSWLGLPTVMVSALVVTDGNPTLLAVRV